MSIDNKRIIYPTDEGGVAVIIPAPGIVLEVVLKAVPAGKEYKIVDAADVPTDRTFRAAWEVDANKKSINVNIDKAKAVRADQLRADRAPLLAELDVEVVRAMEAGDTAKLAEIAAKKQKLRDVTKTPALLNATTVEELKAVTLPEE